MEHLGRHLILEYWEATNLDNPELTERALTEAALAGGATLLSVRTHQFAPQGVSGVAIIAESHISIHTWPEYNYAAVDIFTCGDRVDPHKMDEVLSRYFRPKRKNITEMLRGLRMEDEVDEDVTADLPEMAAIEAGQL